MSVSIYDLTIGSYLQTLSGVTAFLAKGVDHFASKGIDLNEVVTTKLAPDMLPLRFQVFCVAHHSIGAIKGIQEGYFGPPTSIPDLDYNELQALISDTTNELMAISREPVDGTAGGSVLFKIGETDIPFTTENFIMSFSLPNLYFHAVTTYDILRLKGVPLGKRDFLGQMRVGL